METVRKSIIDCTCGLYSDKAMDWMTEKSGFSSQRGEEIFLFAHIAQTDWVKRSGHEALCLVLMLRMIEL